MDLEAQSIVVRFEGHPALEAVSVRLPLGSHVGVCGGPGSGKTTLLKALAGLRPVDEGRVLWNGEDVAHLGAEERRARQAAFGMVFQSDALFDSSTVLENVLVPLLRRKVPKPEAHARAMEALEQVGLTQAAGQLPEQLSGGMRKRAGIARAVAARPKVLLADDPVAGLDPSTGAQVGELLRAVAKDRTLVVALPDPVPWLPLPRWLLLERGKVVYDGPYDEAKLERE